MRSPGAYVQHRPWPAATTYASSSEDALAIRRAHSLLWRGAEVGVVRLQTGGGTMRWTALVREDLACNDGDWTTPGFRALAVYRFGRYASEQRGLKRALLRRAHRVGYVLVRNL